MSIRKLSWSTSPAPAENVWRYDGETGEGGLLPIKAVDLAIGPGGTVYTWGTDGGYHGPIARYTRDLKPAPLAATGKHTFGHVEGRAGRGIAVCGMDVDCQGRVYVTDGSNVCHVRVYDAEGKLVAYAHAATRTGHAGPRIVPAAVDYVSGYGGSIRVDRRETSTCCSMACPGSQPPRGYENDPAYRMAVGTILKFGPHGGAECPRSEGGRGGDSLAFAGTLAMYPGCGPISSCAAMARARPSRASTSTPTAGSTSRTRSPSRSPSATMPATRSSRSATTATSIPRGAAVPWSPRPEIPIGWPITAGATEKYIYIGDCLNHRVVRVDRRFAAEYVCDIPEQTE